ncbi:MAG: ABC transporter permease [Myxococcaceae bacterium]
MAVARREFRSFFNSPVAYIVIGVFLIVAGWFYFSTLFLGGEASLRYFFRLAPLLFVFFVPAVTMRLLAEERKSGTLELLLSLPVQDWQVVVGKFLGALGMVSVALACTLPYPIIVASLAAPGVSFDWGPVITGYLGLLLLASSFLAVGLWASALSRNQIVGLILGLAGCFALYFVDKFAFVLPPALAGVVQYLSVDYHFDNISRGVIDTRDLFFYLSLTAAGLLFTSRTLSAARR